MGAEIEDETVERIDPREHAGAHFTACRFEGLHHERGSLASMSFDECDFIQCNLRLADVTDAAFRDCRFVTCNLMGVDWTRARWPRFVLRPAVNFADSTLDYGNFFGLGLRESTIYACRVREAAFNECDLSSARLQYSDFARSAFTDADLRGADLTGAVNADLPFDHVRLDGCTVSSTLVEPLLRQLGLDVVDVHPERREADDVFPPR